MPRDWSARENRLIVSDYFAMLLDELRGITYSKARHNETLRRALSERSKGSVERKHMNVSAVMLGMGLPIIDGYKPYGHRQRSLAQAVDDYLSTNPRVREELDRFSLSLPAEARASSHLPLEVTPPQPATSDGQPSGLEGRPVPRQYDYAERDARNRALGKLGERCVLEMESNRLRGDGRTELARKVEWTSEARGDGCGFDIRSFTYDGGPLYLEVKTTNFGFRTPFFITRDEVEFSRAERKRYRLVRLFYFSDPRRSFYSLDGSVEENCRLEACDYRASAVSRCERSRDSSAS